MKDRLTSELIAMRVAKELSPGDYCNLGIGIPLLCASYISEGVIIQSENGVLGYRPVYDATMIEQIDPDVADAGMRYLQQFPGMSFFDTLTSFSMIRAGRLISVLGGLQVSEKGDLAVHSLGEDASMPHIGGSMDLSWGAKRVIVAMTHNSKDGKAKVVRELSLPVTCRKAVNLLVTDLAVFQVTDQGLVLTEYAPGWNPEEVLARTDARVIVAKSAHEIDF
jgi:3-oxoacid CoA-transferase B subunit